MSLAITLPTFGRLDCVQRCLDSLPSGPDILIYPDLVSDEELAILHHLASLKPSCHVQERPSARLYGCCNIYRSLHDPFEKGYTQVLHLNSDLVCSPHLLPRLQHFQLSTNLPAQTTIDCKFTLAEKHHFSSFFWHNFLTGTNMLLTSDHWRKVSGNLQDYVNRHLLPGPYQRDQAACVEWLSTRAAPLPSSRVIDEYKTGVVGTGLDSALYLCLLLAGLDMTCLCVNRVIHSSTEGENMTPEFLHYLSDITLDILDEDKSPSGPYTAI